MCPIPVTFQSAIRIYCDLDTIVIQKITSRKNFLSLVMKRRSSEKRKHVMFLMEEIVAMAKEYDARTTVEIGSATRKNLMGGVIKMRYVLTLETMLKRE